MSTKKEKVPTYGLSDFAFIPPLESATELNGFFIRTDQPEVAHELFDSYFRSDFFVIFLVTKGEVRININLEEYSVRKNSMVVTTPNDLKQSVFSRTGEISVVAFTADFLTRSGMAKNIPELFNYFSTRFSPHWKLKREDGQMMKELLYQLSNRYQVLHQHPFGMELLYTGFNTFLWELAGLGKKYAIVDEAHPSRKEDLVIQFTNLVQQQFRSERSVQRYAAQLHISSRHLTETVKEISGRTAGEIIDDFVVQESRLLLSNQQLSIAEIAEELNFSDQSFFGKFFKRHTGLSPKAYRKLLK